jgi:hypothetical protein
VVAELYGDLVPRTIEVRRVGESLSGDVELRSHNQLREICESSVGAVGGSKKNERAMATAASSSVARRGTDGHVLCAPLAQRPHSIVSFSR